MITINYAADCRMQQLDLLDPRRSYTTPKGQLLKWIGNKQRFATDIAAFFPKNFRTFYEPFLGSGALMATVAPPSGFATDIFGPLIEIFQTLAKDPETLKEWYAARRNRISEDLTNKVEIYESVKASYNKAPNGADLLFLCRACYGGVVRFRKGDGYMSTPCGVHAPIAPESFDRRVDAWHTRFEHVTVQKMDYRESIARAGEGDLVYCDPPYAHSQSIIYGAQDFRLEELFKTIEAAKERGARVALSIDGKKRSGDHLCEIGIPEGLFEQEVFIENGRCMLKRFQMEGQNLEDFHVADRLLLTYTPD